MPLVAGKSTRKQSFPIPSEGPHAATITAVKDLGLIETTYGPKHRCRFDWTLDKTTEDGQKLMAFQTFNLNFGDKSTLRKNVKQLLGYDPGPQYDLEELVGLRATLVIGHDEVGDRTFANVRATLPIRETTAGQTFSSNVSEVRS